jgi:hypothetical protein
MENGIQYILSFEFYYQPGEWLKFDDLQNFNESNKFQSS